MGSRMENCEQSDACVRRRGRIKRVMPDADKLESTKPVDVSFAGSGKLMVIRNDNDKLKMSRTAKYVLRSHCLSR